MNIIQYLIKRIHELGVKEFFGVPGDYNFNIIEEIGFNPETKWIGCCNELNSGYAADGYSRIAGLGAIVTTFGVGELSAINAVAGSYAESVPVVKLVGMPKRKPINDGRILHHSLGRPDYEIFYEMYSKVTEHSVILSTENAQEEIEKALSVAYNQKKPVYIGLYDDLCLEPIQITTKQFEPNKTDADTLNAVISHICSILDESKKPLIISEFPILRYGLEKQMQELIKNSGFMSTTLAMGKGSIDENSKNYIGIYCGDLTSSETSKMVESADCVLGFGILMTDFNSGGFTSRMDFSKVIDIQPNYVKINDVEYKDVYIADVLEQLNKKNVKKDLNMPKVAFGYDKEMANDEDLTQNYIYSMMQDFLNPSDIFVTETGLTSFGSIPSKIPNGVKFCSQTLWGSIGWGTPACLGASIADRSKRVIMLTGEGSHQMTAQEVSTMLRYGVNPIIVVVNNDGYTIERLLCEDPMDEYNDVAKWDYTKFVEAFDGESLRIKVRTKKELLEALNSARRTSNLVYIEAFTGIMDAPEFACKLSKMCSPLIK